MRRLALGILIGMVLGSVLGSAPLWGEATGLGRQWFGQELSPSHYQCCVFGFRKGTGVPLTSCIKFPKLKEDR